MDTELRDFLEEFRKCSLSIIEIVKNENYDELDNKISERQEIINSIGKLNFSKEEINKIVKELEIIPLCNEINEVIISKKNNIKAEMENILVKKRVNNNYNKNVYDRLHILSKRI